VIGWRCKAPLINHFWGLQKLVTKIWMAVIFGFTTLCAQHQIKKVFESVALQRFQKLSCSLFGRKLL
jgi:hypothetical protein